jgi:hypothetical protein
VPTCDHGGRAQFWGSEKCSSNPAPLLTSPTTNRYSLCMPKKKPSLPTAPADPFGLPLLTWDGSAWTARIHLPSWAGTPDCSGPYASATGETSDGNVTLSIEVESVGGEGTTAM